MISPTTLKCLIEDITIGNKDLTKNTLVSLLKDLYKMYKEAQETIKEMRIEVAFQKDLRNKKDDIIQDLRSAYHDEREKSIFKLKDHHVRAVVLDLTQGRPVEHVAESLANSSNLSDTACVKATKAINKAIGCTLEMVNGKENGEVSTTA